MAPKRYEDDRSSLKPAYVLVTGTPGEGSRCSEEYDIPRGGAGLPEPSAEPSAASLQLGPHQSLRSLSWGGEAARVRTGLSVSTGGGLDIRQRTLVLSQVKLNPSLKKIRS